MTNPLATILIQKELNSFSEFAELAVSWNADFRQLGMERFSTTMLQARTGDLLFSHARLGCHVEQRGMTPAGMRTFALTSSDSPEMLWYKHRVGPDCLLLFPAHGEISVFSRPGFSAHTVSMPEQVFVGQLETDAAALFDDHEMVFQLDASRARVIRELLSSVRDVVNAGNESASVVTNFREQVLSCLFTTIATNSSNGIPIRDSHWRAFRIATEFVHEHTQSPLSVGDLLGATGVSERSLQYIFKRETGLTPKAYLSGQRLFGVHRELLQSDNRQVRVCDIANRWGFWHMGQFAADYRRVFRELPSVTLRRGQCLSA